MSFANKLVSRILTLVTFLLVMIQLCFVYFESTRSDVLEFTLSLVIMVFTLGVLVYQVINFCKNSKKYDACFCQNECKVSLTCAVICAATSVISFALATAAYLNYIWTI